MVENRETWREKGSLEKRSSKGKAGRDVIRGMKAYSDFVL